MKAEITVNNRLNSPTLHLRKKILCKKNVFSAFSCEEAEPLSWKFWKKRRYIVVLLAFLGYLSSYSLRVNLSVAIVAMTDEENISLYSKDVNSKLK